MLLGAALVGCVTNQPVQRAPDVLRTPFVGADHSAFAGTGTASVIGQAFLRQRGGGVVTCAGDTVFLLPDSEIYRELTWYLREGRSPLPPSAEPVLFSTLKRTTTCDAAGNFRFRQLPAGSYLLVARVVWTVGSSRQGGFLMDTVTVDERQEASKTLSEVRHIR